MTSIPIYGFDIETDTAADQIDPNIPAGLDHRAATVTSAAIWCLATGDGIVFGEALTVGANRLEKLDAERRLLNELVTYVQVMPAGIIATWNGANFDLPWVRHRLNLHQLNGGPDLVAASDRAPKYEPLPGEHRTGYRARWAAHDHVDVAFAYRQFAVDHDVRHSLKPVATAACIEVIEEDASSTHLLGTLELATYNLSDARATAKLAGRHLANGDTTWLDSGGEP